MTENKRSTASRQQRPERTRLSAKRIKYGKPRLCAGYACKEVSEFGNLCGAHREQVARDVAADLAETGLEIDPQDLQIVVNESLYVQFADRKIRPLRYQPVHRVVMQAALDRPYVYGESVHHINGCKWDNSPANLELWMINQPPGQRARDLAKYARELLALHGNAQERNRYRAS